jgi:hypothetical protein
VLLNWASFKIDWGIEREGTSVRDPSAVGCHSTVLKGSETVAYFRYKQKMMPSVAKTRHVTICSNFTASNAHVSKLRKNFSIVFAQLLRYLSWTCSRKKEYFQIRKVFTAGILQPLHF